MRCEKSQGTRELAEAHRLSEAGDPCRATLCALGTEPHAHCPCGLPMAVGAQLCALCLAEGFRPRKLRPADYLEQWDGVRYPSLRRHRPTSVPPERYDPLLLAILGPPTDPNSTTAALEEAA